MTLSARIGVLTATLLVLPISLLELGHLIRFGHFLPFGLHADVVEQFWREFSDMGRLERHAIDNDVNSAAATARELQQRLRDGLLDV